MLLDMHILEDEQVMLRQRIQALLNPSPTGRSHQEFWGSPGTRTNTDTLPLGTECCYYYH